MVLFSILIPVYNGEKYLRECLDSAVAQGGSELCEIIAVNDGSTDSSIAILEEYESKWDNFRVITLDKNQGLSTVRNVGIDHAQGDYLLFLDCDDYMENGLLRKLSGLIRGDEDIFCFSFRAFSSWMSHDYVHRDMRYESGRAYLSAFVYDGALLFGGNCFKAYSRAFLDRFSIRFNREFLIHEDGIFDCDCLAHVSIAATSSLIGYHYRQGESNSLTHQLKDCTLNAIITYNSKLRALLKQYGYERDEQARERYYAGEMSFFRNYIGSVFYSDKTREQKDEAMLECLERAISCEAIERNETGVRKKVLLAAKKKRSLSLLGLWYRMSSNYRRQMVKKYLIPEHSRRMAVFNKLRGKYYSLRASQESA